VGDEGEKRAGGVPLVFMPKNEQTKLSGKKMMVTMVKA
jgi:hypothetical protein